VAPFAVTAQQRRIYVDPEDARGHELIASEGDFNPGSLSLWRLALSARPWALVVDVGVNYAEMLVGVNLPEGARVLGFEPNTSMHPFIRRTCTDNAIELDLRSEALSDRVGRSLLAVDMSWSGASKLTDSDPGDPRSVRCVEVDTTTLDDVVGTGIPWCAKVDVEGWEPRVLAGARRAMNARTPWALMLEVLHLSPSYVATLASEHVLLLLDRRTRRLVRVPGDNRSLAEQMLSCGWLYPQDCLLVSDDVAESLAVR